MIRVKVGDTVAYRGCFGAEAPTRAKVTGIEITRVSGSKCGREVASVSWDTVRADRALFFLDDGHWAYGRQIVDVL